jgi:hypothetical protein
MSEKNPQVRFKQEQLLLQHALTEDKLPEAEKHIIMSLFEASYAEEAVMTRTIHELASHPEESLPGILHVINNPYKLCWEVAFRVLQEMGYPQNESALTRVILLTAEPHAFPGYNEAMRVLQSIQPHDLAPYLIQVLWDRGQDIHSWSEVVGRTCLTVQELGHGYVRLCGPVIAYLLGQESIVHRELMLSTFEILSPQERVYLLPMLIELLSKEGVSHLVRNQARTLMASFPQAMIQPYARVLPPSQKGAEGSEK